MSSNFLISRRIPAALLGALLAVSVVSSAGALGNKEAKNLLEQRRAAHDINSATAENEKQRLAEAEATLQQTISEIYRVTESLRKVDGRIGEINSRIGGDEKTLKEKGEDLAMRAKEIYKRGDQHAVWLISSLLYGDLGDSIRILEYITTIEEKDARLFQELEETTRALRQERGQLNSMSAEKAGLISTLREREMNYEQRTAKSRAAYEEARQKAASSELELATAESEYKSRLNKATRNTNNYDPQASTTIGSYMSGYHGSAAQSAMAGRINSFIDRKFSGAPLSGYGMTFVRAGEMYGLDPRLLVAIGAVESSEGLGYSASTNNRCHNAWGYLAGGKKIEFSSWEQGIFVLNQHIADQWGSGAGPGDLVNPDYCVPPHPWIEKVSAYINEI